MSERIFGALCLIAAAGCGSEAPPPPDPGPSDPAFRITASIEEVMRYMVDPAADAIWDAVVTEVTSDGIVSTEPATDEEWELLRRHAVTLTESTDLLLMDERPVAQPGSRSEMPGVDLEPEEIQALLDEDHVAWRAFVSGLHGTGLRVLAAVDAKDLDALLVAGDELDLACENCHIRYWYPSLEGRTRATTN